MTKEELLSKGLTAEQADMIIATLEKNNTPESALESLSKALNDPVQTSLFKANDGDDEDGGDGEDDYDPEYMKKYMKKYMMANKKVCAKAAKDAGLFTEDMRKALEIDPEQYTGTVGDYADVVPILESIVEGFDKMTKAIQEISGQVIAISPQLDRNYSLLEKAAKVTLETAGPLEILGKHLNQSQGRKGVVTPNANMAKAAPVAQINEPVVYAALMKATKNGDKEAGEIIGKYEVAKQHNPKTPWALLSKAANEKINELIQAKGGK